MTTIAATSTRTALPGMIIRNNVSGCIADLIAPKVSCPKKTGKYYKYDDSQFNQESDEYSTRGGANEISRNYSTANYDIDGFAYKEWIDGDVFDDADLAIRPELKQGAILGIKDGLKLKSEKRMSDLLFSGTTFSGYTSALSGTDQWDNAASDPLAQFKTAATSIMLNGKNPANSVIFGYEAWVKGIAYNPALLDLLGNNSIKIITPDVLSQLFIANQIPIQEVLIGSAIQNTADEGATASDAFVWGKGALFMHNDMRQNTVRGNTTVKTFVLKNKPMEYKFYKDADQDKEGLWAFGRCYYEHNVIDASLGYYFSTVVS